MDENRCSEWVYALLEVLPTGQQAARCATADALARLYREWIEHAVDVLHQHAKRTRKTDALAVKQMADSIVDQIDFATDTKQLPFEEVMSLCAPLDDLILGLKFIAMARSKGDAQ